MRTIQARTILPPEVMASMKGKRIVENDLAAVAAGGYVDILKPDGSPLLLVRRSVFSPEMAERAYAAFEVAGRRYGSNNRASYAGLKSFVRPNSKTSTSFSPEGKSVTVHSATIGYMSRQGGRLPYCRSTQFTAKELEHWPHVEEISRFVARLMKQLVPKRYAAQETAAASCNPAWIIRGTPFSTLTANKNVLGAIHKDAGDFPDGFGIITCHRRGQYRGGHLGFAQYGVGVDLRDGDLIAFDPHDWHGVTNMTDKSEDADRVTAVYYLRQDMKSCGSVEEERARVRTAFDSRSMARAGVEEA